VHGCTICSIAAAAAAIAVIVDYYRCCPLSYFPGPCVTRACSWLSRAYSFSAMTHSSFSDIAQRGKVKARFSALLILQGILQGTSLKRSTNQGRGERSAENSPALFFTLDNTLLDPGFLLVSCKMNEIRASRSAKCEMRTTCICMMILLRRQLGICRTPSGFASCSATLSNTRCVSRNAQRHYATSLLFPSRYYARMPSRTIIRRGRTST